MELRFRSREMRKRITEELWGQGVRRALGSLGQQERQGRAQGRRQQLPQLFQLLTAAGHTWARTTQELLAEAGRWKETRLSEFGMP